MKMANEINIQDMLVESLNKPIGIRLKEWILAHSDKIEKAFLSWIDNELRFVIIRKEMIFDYEFEQDMYGFEHDLYHMEGTRGIDIDFMCLPKCSIDGASTFLGNDFLEIKF